MSSSPKPYPVSDQENLLPGETLHRLLHAYKSSLRQGIQHAKIPVTISHKRILKWLFKIPGLTPHQLAERSGLDKGRVTRLLNDLLNDNLISKHPNPDDKRSLTLHLTDDGIQMINRIRDVEKNIRARMARNLSAQQIQHFVEVANLMADNLDQSSS